MKYLLPLIITLLVTPVRAEYARSAYDGDTITMESGEKVRLACIDTPEMRNNSHGKANKPAAIAARDYLWSLIANKDLRVDPVTKDRYGRTVARIFVGPLDVSQQMVASGHASVYTQYAKPCPWAQVR